MSSQPKDGSEQPFDPFHNLCRFNLFFRLKIECAAAVDKSGRAATRCLDWKLGLTRKKRMVGARSV
jgi:hypothetical protein